MILSLHGYCRASPLAAAVGMQLTQIPSCTPAPTSPNALPPPMTWPWSPNHSPSACHNELFSHSERTGQKWQESCKVGGWDRKKREWDSEGGVEWRDTRKLEGGRAQQRCKVVGNQGRGKSEAGVWTEWQGHERGIEGRERVQPVRWFFYVLQLE